MSDLNKAYIKIHYDVPRHEIPLVQFVNSANSLKNIIDDFNKEIFDKNINYELFICAPEEGGLKEICKIVVISGGLLWASLESDIGKAYIKGLTGNQPSYYAEEAGVKTGELVKDPKIISDMVVGFLQKETEELEKIGMSKHHHKQAYDAKNTIFQGCLDNSEVQGLGFDDSHNFPIQRSDFERHISPLSRNEEEEENTDWVVETSDLIVYSPNWKREKNLVWRGDTTKFKDVSFVIEDEAFWKHVEVKDIQPDVKDNIRVQWAYIANNTKPKNVRVLRVLNYNGKEISKQLSGSQLDEALGNYTNPLPDIQADLLESLEHFDYSKKES